MKLNRDERPFLIPYSPQAAVELAARGERGAPVMLWRVLYPLWEVELPGTRITRRDLSPLEATMLRAIREGAARTMVDLAFVLGIEQALLERVIAVQQRVGHITRSGDDLALGRLGVASLRDQISYRRAEAGRGTAYFDGFTLHPLPDLYGRQQMLDPAERDDSWDQRFFSLLSARAWEPNALKPVITGRTLPDVTPRALLLPMYLVATGAGAVVALTDTRERRDRVFEEQIAVAIEQDPFLGAALAVDAAQLREAAKTWLVQQHLTQGQITITAAGEVRAAFSPEAFQRDQKPLTLQRLGEYELIAAEGGGQACLRLWCADRATRAAAAAAQERTQRARQPDLTAAQLAAHESQRAIRLELQAPDQITVAPTPAGQRKKPSRA